MPLSSCSPRVVETRIRTCHEIDGPRHEHLTRLCGFAYATCEVDGDTRELGAASIDFTGVDPDANVEADLAGGKVQLDDTYEDFGEPLAFWTL
jgi:hypothetical protein